MAVLFDWSNAYGNVVHNKLLEILINLDVPYSFISFIKSFLTDRYSYVQVNQSRGEQCPITRGLPQGAILSPLYSTSMFLNFKYLMHHLAFMQMI